MTYKVCLDSCHGHPIYFSCRWWSSWLAAETWNLKLVLFQEESKGQKMTICDQLVSAEILWRYGTMGCIKLLRTWASHLELQVRPDDFWKMTGGKKRVEIYLGTINIYGKWWITIYKWNIYPKFWCSFMIFSIQWLSLGGYTPFLVRPKMVDFPGQDSLIKARKCQWKPHRSHGASKHKKKHPMMPWSSRSMVTAWLLPKMMPWSRPYLDSPEISWKKIGKKPSFWGEQKKGIWKRLYPMNIPKHIPLYAHDLRVRFRI